MYNGLAFESKLLFERPQYTLKDRVANFGIGQCTVNDVAIILKALDTHSVVTKL